MEKLQNENKLKYKSNQSNKINSLNSLSGKKQLSSQPKQNDSQKNSLIIEYEIKKSKTVLESLLEDYKNLDN